MNSYRWKIPLIVTITALFLGAWLGFGLTYGIDLKGGSVLIYELPKPKTGASITPATTKATIDILQRRLDTLGMKEMSIRQAGDYQIMIQLPGVSEQSSARIKDVIKKAGQLWFKIVVERGEPRYDDALIRDIEERKARGEYVMEENEFDTAHHKPRGAGQAETLLVMNDGAVEGRKLEGADFMRDSWGAPAVRFHMKPEGRRALASTTEKFVNKRMAIVLDGNAISAPVIRNPITEGTGEISGQFTQQEVDDLITVLKSGALPAKPVLASENTIEPTLGQESIRLGMLAVGGSVLAVILFMFVFYKSAGTIANIALLCNIVILLGFMALFEATLTLPGIAGIVLTIGMAVDANILIYERIREEKRRGLQVEDYVEAGYGHAFWAIFDTHVTTFLSALILNYVGTGPIKGFAVTLMIGIAISFFTALFVTKTIYEYLFAKGMVKEVKMIQLVEKVPNYPWLDWRRPLVIFSVILLNLGYLSFVVRGDQKYGIDFNGGTAVQLRLRKPLTKGEIEERLAKVEKKTADGATEKPYAGAEVVRMGNPDDPKTGAGRSFQVLVSGQSLGKTKRGAKGSAMAPVELMPAAHGADAPTGQPAAAAGGGAPGAEITTANEQEIFVQDIQLTFAAELMPPPFGERRVEPDAAAPGRGRFSFDVNLAADKKVDAEEAKKALAADGFPDADVKSIEGDGRTALRVTSGAMEIDSRSIDRVEQKMKSVFEAKFTGLISNPFPFKTSIGSSVAESLKYRAILAILLSLLMIVVYLAFRFEFKMGIAAALCLFHDVLVTVGFMMLLDVTSKWTGIDAKQNLTTIAAYLTIVGFSINDTIVTFDRMRENLSKWDPKTGIAITHSGDKRTETYEQVLNRSINETLSRTILTSSTVFITVLILAVAAVMGVKSIEGFSLALLIGVVFGTYSSIAIATPLLLLTARQIVMVCLAELGFFIVAAVIGSQLAL